MQSQSHPMGPPPMSSHGTPINRVIAPPPKPVKKPVLVVQQKEVQEASERLEDLQQEQNALERELQKKSEIFELNKQRIKDAESFFFFFN